MQHNAAPLLSARLRCPPWDRQGLVLAAELRQLAHRRPVFLVYPGKFQPEFVLRLGGRGIAARHEYPQRGVAIGCPFTHRGLQSSELIQCPARQQSL